ncbi:family 16 glycosylhydrolase [Sphingomonas glacialis]|nr:family 16 glycosylhydrolase [Sphingomonas glacialis]
MSFLSSFALTLSACGGGDASASAPAISVVPAAATATPTPAPLQTPAPTPTPTAAASSASAASVAMATLPALDMRGNVLWNWSAPWLASEWGSVLGVVPWKFDHVTTAGTDVVLTMNQSGAAQLQAQGATPAYSQGLWEADVSIPTLRSGVDVAAFYLYSNDTKDEVDFEFFGTLGLFATLHSGGKSSDSIKVAEAADFNGRRARLGIKIDQSNGYIAMMIDGREVHRFQRATAPVFPASAMKPFFDLQPGTPAQDSWLGHWNGFSSQADQMQLIIHGYRYS